MKISDENKEYLEKSINQNKEFLTKMLKEKTKELLEKMDELEAKLNLPKRWIECSLV